MNERRNSRRSKSFLRGFVYVSRKHGALACHVRDLSEKGARIIFSDTVTLPDVLELYIPQREQTLRARVQWRRNDELGLAFIEAPRAAEAEPTAAEVAQRVAMLEAEIASLRTVLKRLKDDKDGANDEAAA
jgi:PilZ domain-containing protein